ADAFLHAAIVQHLGQVAAHAAQQHHHVLLFHLSDKVVEQAQADRVRVAHVLELQHDHLDVAAHTTADQVQVVFQVWSRAEEQLPFQAEYENAATGRVRRLTLAQHPFGCEGQLDQVQPRCPGNIKNERKKDPDQDAELDGDDDSRQGRGQDDAGVKAGGTQ